jgi:hypothetical protein
VIKIELDTNIINDKIREVENNSNYMIETVDNIVNSYTSSLDELM